MTLSVCFGMGEYVAEEVKKILGRGLKSAFLSDDDIYDPQLTSSNYTDIHFPHAFPPVLSNTGTFESNGEQHVVTHPIS
jgi:hypothetical protein